MLQLLLKVCKSQNLVWNKMNSPPRIPDFRRPKINLLNFTITKFLFRVNFLIFLMKWKLKTTKNCKTMTFSRFFFVWNLLIFFSWNHSWKRPNIAKPLQFHGVLCEFLNFSRGIKNAFVGVMKQNNYKNSVSYHMYYHTCSIAYDDFFLTFHLFFSMWW